MTLPRVAITTLGCKTNQFESAAMTESLGKKGFPIVSFDTPADVYIINTCTVTARTDAESRRIIRRAMRRNPDAKIVVTGCYAQVSPAELEKMPGVHLIIGNGEKRDISSLLRQIGSGPKVRVSDISREKSAEALPLETFAEHTRAFLQVQNGCDAFCSYCIVPYARGRSRSVAPHDALTGIAAFTAGGFREVVLTGIHLSGYGLDLLPPTSLFDLLLKVEQRQLTPRLRLGSLEPAEISDDLIDLLATSGIICRHLHIPLQSGDDEVLRRMNRSYCAGFFRDLVYRLAEKLPDLCIGLDIIAGFPGETEQEFGNTLTLLQTLPIAYLHVFPFSPRPGTPAATMTPRVATEAVTERARLLRHLSDEKKQAYCRQFVGKEVEVLVQSQDAAGLLHGLSRHYLPVSFAGPADLHNHEVPVRVLSSANAARLGELA